ncbi:hypothetical protein LTR10_005150 [Elasticomyces elasticus]|nr:hypothetical protein LTR10_005150 [Elasticomyces elasticus]KAK4975890.1 hypothetical protein LTR42_003511 [Elasticomyces elasticus]
MASVKNEQALQRQLDEALKVADYLKRKLNSLENIIGDLSEQDVKALFEGYSDDMESLEKTVLGKVALRQAGGVEDPAARPTPEISELESRRMLLATPSGSPSGSMNMLKGVEPTLKARQADVMPRYPCGADVGGMADAARPERREEHIMAPSMSPITRPMDVPVPRRRAKNLSQKLRDTYAGVLKSIRAKEKKNTATGIHLLARQAREEMIRAEARKRAEDIVFEEECAAELAELEAAEAMENAKAAAMEAEVAAMEAEEARMNTEALGLQQTLS